MPNRHHTATVSGRGGQAGRVDRLEPSSRASRHTTVDPEQLDGARTPWQHGAGRSAGKAHQASAQRARSRSQPPAARSHQPQGRQRGPAKGNGIVRQAVAVRYTQESMRTATATRSAAWCRLLAVSRTGYLQRRGRPPSARAQASAAHDVHVAAAHAESGATYGRPHLVRALAARGICVRGVLQPAPAALGNRLPVAR